MTTEDNLIYTFLTGMGATAMIDLWALARRRLLGVPLPNYALVGRWIAHLARGRMHHDSIAATPKVGGERAVGWFAHYFIGIAFASMLPVVWGSGWFRAPEVLPALIVGIVSVAAPFLIMQPAMGSGFAASRAPRPVAARIQSLVTHGIFGLGLFGAGLFVNKLLTGE